jgi:hypothetical protein
LLPTLPLYHSENERVNEKVAGKAGRGWLRICEEITDDKLRVRMASRWGILAPSVTGYFEEYPDAV